MADEIWMNATINHDLTDWICLYLATPHFKFIQGQGCKFNENQRIDSRNDSRSIHI